MRIHTVMISTYMYMYTALHNWSLAGISILKINFAWKWELLEGIVNLRSWRLDGHVAL